jgi:predicted nucleic acid-binding protein
MDAVRLLRSDIQPIIDLIWIDQGTHDRALEQLVAANRRQLSLVDFTSFTTMRDHRIECVFAFDRHFEEQGFRLFPGS